jgi:hypothetical protein
MEIQIVNRFTETGKEYIEWDLYDGPDGIEHAHGYAVDLIHAFSKIVEWQERISRDYIDELTENNETND